MNRFISGDIAGQPFVMFSEPHLIALGIILAACVLLSPVWFRFRKGEIIKISATVFAVILLANEMIYTAWTVYAGVWGPDYSLPLQLCDITAFLAAFMLLKNNYLSFEIVYFLGLGGSLQALATPDLYYPFPHLVFISFFAGHGVLILSVLLMIFARGYSPAPKSILKSVVAANIYMAFAAIINVLTHGNYMFLCSKPQDGSLMDYLGPWPWYILSLEGVGLVTCCILYIPFAIKNHFERNAQHRSPGITERSPGA